MLGDVGVFAARAIFLRWQRNTAPNGQACCIAGDNCFTRAKNRQAIDDSREIIRERTLNLVTVARI